jgi:hypothetical protein
LGIQSGLTAKPTLGAVSVEMVGLRVDVHEALYRVSAINKMECQFGAKATATHMFFGYAKGGRHTNLFP